MLGERRGRPSNNVQNFAQLSEEAGKKSIDFMRKIMQIELELIKACFSLRNLRPIWPDDNRDKYWSVDRVFNKKRKQHISFVNQ